MAKRRKAPPGCFWHGNVLWAALMVKGQRHRWSLETDDPRVAKQRREATKQREIAQRFGDPSAGGHTVQEAVAELDAYFDDRQVGQKTRDRYYCSLGMMADCLEGRRLPEVNNALLSEIVRVRRAAGATNATIKRDLVALSAIMNCAIAKGWIEANPVLAFMKQIKERRNPIVLPERVHIDLVITRAPGMIAHAARAAVNTGAREDELVKLRRSDIDHDRQQMTVRRHDDGGPKGGKTRAVDLRPFGGYEHLRSLPAYAKSEWVFWHDAGEPYLNFASRFSEIVKRTAAWAKENGVPFRRFRFHDLRHFHAVEFLKSGRDIYDLQKRLGHSSVKVTEMYLAYLTAEEERIAKFGKAATGAG